MIALKKCPEKQVHNQRDWVSDGCHEWQISPRGFVVEVIDEDRERPY
jgi:hypothetical protein